MSQRDTTTRRLPWQAADTVRYSRRGRARALTALAGLLTLLIAGCATGGTSGETLAQNQTFIWPYTGIEKIGYDAVLDPAVVTDLKDVTTNSMLYTNLVTFDSNLHVVPDAARALPEVDPTGTVYTFHLRPDLHFSDGAPLTAQDFAYGIDRSLSQNLCKVLDAKTYGDSGTGVCSAPPVAENYLGHILGAIERSEKNGPSLIGSGDDPKKGIDVLDPLTLRIRLDKPVAYFLDGMTYSTSAPLEKALVENPQYTGGFWVDHLDLGGTSGPFKVKSYNGGASLTLVPNTYWETAFHAKLHLTEVDRPAVLAQDAEYNDYRKGKYDYTIVPLKDFSFARDQVDFHEIPTLETDYFGINVTKAPFDNPQVRIAFSLALNKQLLIDRIENGGALPTNHIVPNGMPGFNLDLRNPLPDDTKSVTGNQAAAVQVLGQAQQACAQGNSPAPDSCAYITGTKPSEIDVWTNGANGTRAQLVEAAAQTWSSALTYQADGKPIALNVKAKNTRSGSELESSLYARDPNDSARTTNPYQIWAIGWVADYPDPQDFLSLQFHTGAPNNNGGFSDKSLDILLDQADTEHDFQRRMAEYNTIEKRLIDTAAWIPYQQSKYFWRQRTWVHGFSVNPIQNVTDISWPDVYITTH